MEFIPLIVLALIIVLMTASVIAAHRNPYLSAKAKANWTYVIIALPFIGAIFFLMSSPRKQVDQN